MNKPWYERMKTVSKEEYDRRFTPWNHGRYEAERLESSGVPPGVRISDRTTGRMLAGWDKDRDGTIRYWVVKGERK
jgi:hypothetical protein